MKKSFTVTTMPYLTHGHLCEIADRGEQWDFNRQLCPRAVRTLPSERGVVYPVDYWFTHEHRHFQPCEQHMRLVISMPDSIATADVPLDYFERLPKAHCVRHHGKVVFVLLVNENGKPWSVRYGAMTRQVRRAIHFLRRKSKAPTIKKYLEVHLDALAQAIA